MKNNRGLGRFETIVVILLVLIIFTVLFKVFVDGAGKKDFKAMRQDAASFGKTVSTNANFYHNSDMVSLGEAIGEKTIEQIKNPVGKGYCDEGESKVVLENDKYLITLRCGEYLIEKAPLNAVDTAPIYEVSDWKDEKTEGADTAEVYNCEVNGKEVYNDYYDELYFVYKVNQDNATSYYNANSVNSTCQVLKKEVYREKKLLEEK